MDASNGASDTIGETKMATRSYQNWINGSRNNIAQAKAIATDRGAAIEYVNRVYKGCDKRGMWKSVQKQARKVLELVEQHGLSEQKPVKYVREQGGIRCYGILFSCDFIVPLFSGGVK